MRRRYWILLLLLVVLLVLAVLLDGCKVPQDRPLTREAVREAACPSWRWVGVKSEPNAECPGAGSGWTAEHLFAPAGEDPTRPGPVPPGLRSFCVYQRSGDGGDEALSQLRENGSLARLEQDCMGSAPSADAGLEGGIWESLNDHFLAQAGDTEDYLSDEPLQSLLVTQGSVAAIREAETSLAPVRLAFLDSQPTNESLPKSPGNSSHGYSLAHMARHLVCETPATESEAQAGDTQTADVSGRVDGAPTDLSALRCAAQITTQLALPVVSFDKENAENTRRGDGPGGKGGYFGTLTDLAKAVQREVEDWSGDNPKQQHLVLNLSVGWDSGFFGGVGKGIWDCANLGRDLAQSGDLESEPAALAVYCALRDAACRGALVVAAAGNRSGGPEPRQGPLLPAAWQARDAPTGEVCRQVLQPQPDDATPMAEPGDTRPEPLVYAAGGVTSRGLPLANSRPSAEPPRVAYADHAVVEGYTPGERTAVLTGSSVSAAVVSATAAAVWARHPELSRRELMAILHAAGDDLKRSAAFHHPAEPDTVHRVSLCRTLACVPGWAEFGTCPAEILREECGEWSRQAPVLGDLVRSNVAEWPAVSAESLVTHKSGGPCEAAEIYYPKGKRPRNPCPFDQFYSAPTHPWTSPQPDDPPCPGCPFYSNSPCTLAISIPSDWERGTLHDATYAVDDRLYALGNLEIPDHHGLGQLDANQFLVVRDFPGCTQVTDFTSGSLSFRLEYQGETMSVESPVLIAR